jgi:ferredoxin
MTELKNLVKSLLEEGKVTKVIGYRMYGENNTKPYIAVTPNDAEEMVLNTDCRNNLSVYLTKKEIINGGKTGIVAKGCDIRNIIALIQENRIKEEDILIISAECKGVGAEKGSAVYANKCVNCSVKTPHLYHELVEMKGSELSQPKDKYTEAKEKVLAMNSGERFEYFSNMFSECIKCYACRQACPMCYCEQCIADMSIPRWIESSATDRGNLSWNMIRAFHLSGRCTGCNECERACPAEIPLSFINKLMYDTAKEEFNYESGMNKETPTLIGSYNTKDNDNFIQ